MFSHLGKGLIESCVAKGIRGYIGKRKVIKHFDLKIENVSFPYMMKLEPYYSIDQRYLSTRGSKNHMGQTGGDFDLRECIVQDAFVTIRNPEFRPFTITIFNGHCTPLRKQWLLYDLLTAKSITGIFDDSLFSIRGPQYELTHNEIPSRSVRADDT